ncbi:hypothetical protein KCP73_11060 [Salmonella enterica subsp. enterica]|nr:hypothetical protein KCP73_11060 [Salmonella enterica subsp. enterica]
MKVSIRVRISSQLYPPNLSSIFAAAPRLAVVITAILMGLISAPDRRSNGVPRRSACAIVIGLLTHGASMGPC